MSMYIRRWISIPLWSKRLDHQKTRWTHNIYNRNWMIQKQVIRKNWRYTTWMKPNGDTGRKDTEMQATMFKPITVMHSWNVSSIHPCIHVQKLYTYSKLAYDTMSSHSDFSSQVGVRQPFHNMNHAVAVFCMWCGHFVLWASFQLDPSTCSSLPDASPL